MCSHKNFLSPPCLAIHCDTIALQPHAYASHNFTVSVTRCVYQVGYATDAAQRSQLMPLGTGDTAHGLPLGTNLSAAQTALQVRFFQQTVSSRRMMVDVAMLRFPLQTALMYAESQADNERLDDEGGGLLSGVNPRISLMQKLQRLDSNSGTAGGMSRPGVATPTGGALPTVTPPFLGLLNAAPPTGAIVPNPTAPYAGNNSTHTHFMLLAGV